MLPLLTGRGSGEYKIAFAAINFHSFHHFPPSGQAKLQGNPGNLGTLFSDFLDDILLMGGGNVEDLALLWRAE